ncbi:DUF2071 domain-containing protein [Verrucomicrobiales bacterium]|jgi:hypothetical protein|nr:DUF2071 domain-containing protein [Verrucomicrobiales bacterium]MDA9924590.1 DUF2071 domain-containing protein [Verrucomicrobiales bacterium]
MNIPVITGVIRRRILLNYRVAPEAVARILPGQFQPKLMNGFAVAGICLIRLEHVRPKGLPSFMGISSENSAHRIAVEWEDGQRDFKEGVFVPRRDTDSLLNALAGGRIFPGVHHHSRFHVKDDHGKISIRVEADGEDAPLVEIEAEESKHFPADSIFSSLEESSRFFEAGCVGYSSRPDSCKLDGLLLKVPEWSVTPLEVTLAKSSFFDDRANFADDQIQFDHALLMRDIQHEWHSEPAMTGEGPSG